MIHIVAFTWADEPHAAGPFESEKDAEEFVEWFVERYGDQATARALTLASPDQMKEYLDFGGK